MKYDNMKYKYITPRVELAEIVIDAGFLLSVSEDVDQAVVLDAEEVEMGSWFTN